MIITHDFITQLLLPCCCCCQLTHAPFAHITWLLQGLLMAVFYSTRRVLELYFTETDWWNAFFNEYILTLSAYVLTSWGHFKDYYWLSFTVEERSEALFHWPQLTDCYLQWLLYLKTEYNVTSGGVVIVPRLLFPSYGVWDMLRSSIWPITLRGSKVSIHSYIHKPLRKV